MADLLSSLILPKNSQESFHSTTSQPQSNVAPEIPSKALILTPPSSAQEQASAFQATDLPVYNIDAYLTDPQNADLLKTSAKGNQSQPKMSQRANDSLEPIPLGSRTSHYVSTFMNLCQSKGLVPFFDIDGDVSNAEFRGALRIGDVTIVSEKRWHSKKEAREALAAKGLETVQKMETKHKEPGIPGEPEKNWVGMLQEYYSSTNPKVGPVYNSYEVGKSFSCECIIPSLPDQPFGSKTDVFPSKKAARINGAKGAVEHLISIGELNEDGSTKARKKVKVGAAACIEGKGLEVKKGATYAQKVQDTYALLGLTAPQYTLKPSTQAPNMVSGYASFPNQPGMPTEIGEVRHIYGKKNAKEEIAKGVWKVLLEVARKRGFKIPEAEETVSE